VRIAIFDYQVKRTNPIGGCHLRMLRALAEEHEFTVFSVAFDNPCPERIKWVRVPAPGRPLALLFVAYHILAPLAFWLYRLKTGERFDLIQTVESKLSFGTVAYSHFCHSSYLRKHWHDAQAAGMRGRLRWLDHWLHACLEERIYERTEQILVPSKGLAEELQQEFPTAEGKVRVLPNAVDVEKLERPTSFEREQYRANLGFDASDVVFIFAALGHFERKGLPLLLEALSRVKSDAAKLLIVGGTGDLIESYRLRARKFGLADRVVFIGMQSDVRPYLWAADAFAIASSYETFSLVAFEAAAASLPLVTPLLHGIEEIVADQETGYVVNRTVEDFANALTRIVDLSAQERKEMGRKAWSAARKYDEKQFVDNWQSFYAGWVSGSKLPDISTPAVQSVKSPS
jgi:glycosyltransferase involved in cell wall biosynthesis